MNAWRASWAAKLALPLLLPVMPVDLGGQNPPNLGEDTPISVNVDLVVLHATVRARNGDFLTGLPESAFHVVEDGQPQTIRLFEYEDTPVSVGLVVDDSGSMASKRKDVLMAALKFAHSSNPKDELFVVNFNENVSFGLPPSQPFTTNFGDLVGALNGVPARGMTALYDGIDAGLHHLEKATRPKKALIVVSDGGDNASRHRLHDVLQEAERSNVIIYTIGLFDQDDDDQNPGVLRKIARLTGGECYLPKETSKVGEVCEKIAQDIRHQYTIGYVPTNQKQDGTYRTIQVKVDRKASVRTRAGYLAPGAPPKS